MTKFKEAFAISDIHGCSLEFLEMLNNWDRSKQLLVLCGDYIDRGDESREVLDTICDLKMGYGDQVVVIRGNHDQMLLDFIEEGQNEYTINRWLASGGGNTLSSYFNSMSQEERSKHRLSSFYHFTSICIQKKYRHHIELLRASKPYYEFGDVLFTHAGIQSLYGEDWKKTTDHEFMWIRDWYKQENLTGKVIVFGHTPTCYLPFRDHNFPNFDVWVHDRKKLIGIDGGCCFEGQLNAVTITNKGEFSIVEPVKQKIV
ncbi:serine/threonine protein phosphatase [Listeria phage LMTA-94]|uniref:Serine/threonine protein phosphatase n=1 Tax=Listeria phage LMTA-94 TaxID=1486419 RepID=A0A068C7K4_9CAUD|nr:serine/threonine protein phosphatase [Listeria phage LMTA-94]AID17243.1 serine/threonine protein phosphatase [Listeria phage LMTA-94]